MSEDGSLGDLEHNIEGFINSIRNCDQVRDEIDSGDRFGFSSEGYYNQLRDDVKELHKEEDVWNDEFTMTFRELLSIAENMVISAKNDADKLATAWSNYKARVSDVVEKLEDKVENSTTAKQIKEEVEEMREELEGLKEVSKIERDRDESEDKVKEVDDVSSAS